MLKQEKTFCYNMKEKNVKVNVRGKNLNQKVTFDKKKTTRNMIEVALRSQRLGITRNLRLLFWQGWYSSIPNSICKSFLKENADFSKNAINGEGIVYSL